MNSLANDPGTVSKVCTAIISLLRNLGNRGDGVNIRRQRRRRNRVPGRVDKSNHRTRARHAGCRGVDAQPHV